MAEVVMMSVVSKIRAFRRIWALCAEDIWTDCVFIRIVCGPSRYRAQQALTLGTGRPQSGSERETMTIKEQLFSGIALLLLLTAALPLWAAQPLFPKPMHLLREIDD